jgi:hypothetical protein
VKVLLNAAQALVDAYDELYATQSGTPHGPLDGQVEVLRTAVARRLIEAPVSLPALLEDETLVEQAWREAHANTFRGAIESYRRVLKERLGKTP